MTDMVNVEVVKIDPARAAELLLVNTANRPLSRSRVQALAHKMSLGEWMLTGQAHVIVGSNGVLLNGQHTLAAVVQSGRIIETIMVTGIDPAAFSRIDIGHKRTAGHVLSINGTSHANLIGAILRIVEMYDSLAPSSRGGWYYRTRLEADEILPLFELDPDAFTTAATVGSRVYAAGRATGVTISRSMAGAFRYLAVREGHDPEVVDGFLTRVAADTGHVVNDPALTLRRWLIVRGTSSFRAGPDHVLFGMSGWIKSFLAAQQGRSNSKIYGWTRESPEFPRL